MDAHTPDPFDFPAGIPERIPVMTLPNTVLFPQALLPLYIFEPRYRQMVTDALQSNRMFAIASTVGGSEELETPEDTETDYFEAPFPVATVGVIRACHENDDGTRNLILQGMSRVRFEEILTEVPYRKASISPLDSSRRNPDASLDLVRKDCLRMIQRKLSLEPRNPEDAYRFLEQIHDPDVFIDLASFSLVDDIRRKQRLLETLVVESRYEIFLDWLRRDVTDLELYRTLKGHLKDEDIPNN